MAIQGEYYFSAQNGTITSAEALANPYHPKATVSGAAFLHNEILRQTITDTHFDNPDRRGRLLSFMAKIYTDEGVATNGILVMNTQQFVLSLQVQRVFLVERRPIRIMLILFKSIAS